MQMLRPLVRLGALALLSTVAAAQDVWTGYSTSFAKPAGANWTNPIRQDRITYRTWLTRVEGTVEETP